MQTRVMTSGVHRLVGLSVVAVLALSGCSGEDDPSSEPSATASVSGSASASVSASPAEPYLPVPAGVTLTDPGTELSVGDDAVVAFEPRQKKVGVLDITVTKLEQTTFKKSFQGWKLDATTRRSTPYFVQVRVENVGDSELGRTPIPLYVVDGNNTLIEASTFASTFRPCPSKPLPQEFAPGDRTKACLVFLAPDQGELTSVTFRPTQQFNPITWIGEIEKLGEKKGTKDKKGGAKKNAQKKGGTKKG